MENLLPINGISRVLQVSPLCFFSFWPKSLGFPVSTLVSLLLEIVGGTREILLIMRKMQIYGGKAITRIPEPQSRLAYR